MSSVPPPPPPMNGAPINQDTRPDLATATVDDSLLDNDNENVADDDVDNTAPGQHPSLHSYPDPTQRSLPDPGHSDSLQHLEEISNELSDTKAICLSSSTAINEITAQIANVNSTLTEQYPFNHGKWADKITHILAGSADNRALGHYVCRSVSSCVDFFNSVSSHLLKSFEYDTTNKNWMEIQHNLNSYIKTWSNFVTVTSFYSQPITLYQLTHQKEIFTYRNAYDLYYLLRPKNLPDRDIALALCQKFCIDIPAHLPSIANFNMNKYCPKVYLELIIHCFIYNLFTLNLRVTANCPFTIDFMTAPTSAFSKPLPIPSPDVIVESEPSHTPPPAPRASRQPAYAQHPALYPQPPAQPPQFQQQAASHYPEYNPDRPAMDEVSYYNVPRAPGAHHPPARPVLLHTPGYEQNPRQAPHQAPRHERTPPPRPQPPQPQQPASSSSAPPTDYQAALGNGPNSPAFMQFCTTVRNSNMKNSHLFVSHAENIQPGNGSGNDSKRHKKD